MEAMYVVFAFVFLCCLGLLSPVLYVAVSILSLLAGMLRRLAGLIGGARIEKELER